MTNRRQFMQCSVAVTMSVSMASAALAAAGSAKRAALWPERFVFDNRFAPARQMAQRMARQGILLGECSGDLTDLWYNHLDLQWRKSPMILAGMTTREGLFVLETLAADHRMRVVQRDELSVPDSAFGKSLYYWTIAPRGIWKREYQSGGT
jgi:hypothetical protein